MFSQLFFIYRIIIKITLSDLAKKFNTNRTTLSQKFLESTGMSITSYLVRQRVQVAAVLVHDTNLPIMEIMHRVGFINMSHFITTFLHLPQTKLFSFYKFRISATYKGGGYFLPCYKNRYQ